MCVHCALCSCVSNKMQATDSQQSLKGCCTAPPLAPLKTLSHSRFGICFTGAKTCDLWPEPWRFLPSPSSWTWGWDSQYTSCVFISVSIVSSDQPMLPSLLLRGQETTKNSMHVEFPHCGYMRMFQVDCQDSDRKRASINIMENNPSTASLRSLFTSDLFITATLRTSRSQPHTSWESDFYICVFLRL